MSDDREMFRKVSETFTLIETWTEAAPGNDDPDEWPFPTEVAKSEITGPLADRIRKRFGADATATVTITEKVISGGYSEYTQEDEFEHIVECDGHEWSSDTEYQNLAGIGRLLAWLNEETK